MIGMINPPVGQFGNQLFQLNTLWQLSENLNTDYFYWGFNSLTQLGIKNARKPDLKQIIRPLKYIDAKSITGAVTSGDLAGLFTETKTKNYLIPSGMMGEYFFDLLFQDPRLLLNLQKTNKHRENERVVKVGLHFRGKDFAQWNPKAVMNSEYYKRAIFQILSENTGQTLETTIFTDDFDNEVVQELLSWKDHDFILSEGKLRQDFLAMGRCDYIVASPSTFVFWASLSWNKPKMIYSHEWIEHRLESKDKFWTKYISNEKFDIRIHKIV